MGSEYRYFDAKTLPVFAAIAGCIVPADGEAPGADAEACLRIADAALAERPPRDQRMLRAFLRVLEWLPCLRYGSRFSRLSPARRARVLMFLESNRWLPRLRQGFFGVKTFALLGYYALESGFPRLGYPGPRLDAPYYRARRAPEGR